MAKTYLDQIVDYPAKAIQKIASDPCCVGLIVNKKFTKVTEDDMDSVISNNLFDYQYVDDTTQTTSAYVWAEMEVNSVQNKHIKGARLYITVACHKQYMPLKASTFTGVTGNRRDNIVRYADRLLNGSDIFGIGALSLVNMRTLSPIGNFVLRELTYAVPDFNIVELTDV